MVKSAGGWLAKPLLLTQARAMPHDRYDSGRLRVSKIAKTELAEVHRVDEDINHMNGIVLIDPRHAGRSVPCPRSAPSTKRFI
jgi:hypothetical protein